MKKKLLVGALCALLVLLPLNGLAENIVNWDRVLSGTVDTVEKWTAPTGTLQVKASASVKVVPDMASVSLGLSVVNEELSAAQAEANATMNAIVEAVCALGIAETDVVTNNYSISPRRDYSSLSGDEKVTGYYVSTDINVTVTDFALLDTVLDTAVSAGANVVYGLNFDVKDRSAYYRQALADAVTAAQEKAAILAKSAGVTLGTITGITETSSVDRYYAVSNAADSMKRAAAGTQIRGGELSVTAEVELTYDYRVFEAEKGE